MYEILMLRIVIVLILWSSVLSSFLSSALSAEAVLDAQYSAFADTGWLDTAIGEFKASGAALAAIEAIKGGAFARGDGKGGSEGDGEEAEWQAMVVEMMNNGLVESFGRKTRELAPGVGTPSESMSGERHTAAKALIQKHGARPGEKVVAVFFDKESTETWTTEAVYFEGCAGGMTRVKKTDAGWSFARSMLEGDAGAVVVMRYWDLALSNTTSAEVPWEVSIPEKMVKLELTRRIAPAAKFGFYSVSADVRAHLLRVQAECRRLMGRRVVAEMNRHVALLTDQSGFRTAKWGSTFAEAAVRLGPFLEHRGREFYSSRETADVALIYGRHPVTGTKMGRPVDTEMWPFTVEGEVYKTGKTNIERQSLVRATKPFSGRLEKFVKDTGIPVAPKLDYWISETAEGKYTAWFVEDKFYAVRIEIPEETQREGALMLEQMAARYGKFEEQVPGKSEGWLVRESAHWGDSSAL